jgi:predicted RND superfamily exporter protein
VTNFLEAKFESTQGDTVIVYVEGPLTRDYALEAIYRAGEDPPDSFVESDGHAESTSIVTVIRDYQQQDPEFRRLVARNDRNANDIPDDNLGEVYDYLLSSPARDQALRYMTEDRRRAQVVYTVEASATQAGTTADARTVADRFRFEATATGSVVVFKAISDLILQSALISLAAALVGTAVFLVFIYWVIEGEPLLGLANLFPIVVTVAFIAGSMRFFGISFNAFTATILAITIGLGIDYSVHVTHRFVDEYHQRPLYEALDRTVRGTGGALAGSMLTTVFGIGTLVLSVFPAIGNFGTLTGLSVIYSFLASLLVLPSALAVWARFTDGEGGSPSADGPPVDDAVAAD